MVVQEIGDKPVYCSECGSIMIQKIEPDTLTAKATRTLYECPECGSMLWYGQIIISSTDTGEKLDWYSVNIGFNHSCKESAKT